MVVAAGLVVVAEEEAGARLVVAVEAVAVEVMSTHVRHRTG